MSVVTEHAFENLRSYIQPFTIIFLKEIFFNLKRSIGRLIFLFLVNSAKLVKLKESNSGKLMVMVIKVKKLFLIFSC